MKETSRVKKKLADLDAVLAAAGEDETARLRAMWAMIGDEESASPTSSDVEAAKRRFMQAIEDAPQQAEPKIYTQRRTTRRAPAWIAVAAAVIVALGFAWWMTPITERAAPGEQQSLTLPDGSTVRLNSATSIRFARSFSLYGAREVELTGEALFDVVTGSEEFTVETFDARVSVLGTRFNVRVRPGEPFGSTTVAVEEGRVALWDRDNEHAKVVVEAGQVRGVESSAVLDSVSVGDAIAWERGDLVFKHRPLEVVLADVRRRFAIDVRVEPAAVGSTEISVALRAPTAGEAVVRDVARALNLRYRAQAGGYVLYQP